jgi:hypothetical protein
LRQNAQGAMAFLASRGVDVAAALEINPQRVLT